MKRLRKILLVGAVCCAFQAPANPARADDDGRWRLCPPILHSYLRPQAEALYESGTTEILADRAEVVEGGTSTFNEQVQIIRDDLVLTGNEVRYDSTNDLFEFSGEAEFWNSGLFWSGEQGRYDGAAELGRLEEGEYLLLERRGRGRVRTISTYGNENLSRLKGVDYSTCAGIKPAWQMRASHIKLNHETDIGTARNVTIWVKKAPVFYSPFLTFPLSDRRKSGFLIPTIGSSNESGFTASIPYYWNIRPNLDATLKPKIMGSRGLMLGAEIRYLLDSGEGQLDVEYLPNDSAFNDESRSLLKFDHLQYLFANRGRLTVDYGRVSDKEYFEDFGGSLAGSSTNFVRQNADFFFHTRHFWIWPRFLSFQTVDRTIPGRNRPYKMLPQILFRTALPAPDNRPNVQLWGETAYFDRDDSLVGTRIEIRPLITWPLHTAGAFFVPTLSLRHRQYYLDNVPDGQDDQPDSTVGVLSIDSGLILERTTKLFGRRHLQTLEPRLYYLYVPEENQDDLPIFNTGEYDFSFAQLFRDNRFSGGDRIADANQISVALTTRWYDEQRGFERLRGSIGQVFYFKDREVTRPGFEPQADSTSELIGEVFARLTDDVSARFAFQWDPNEGRTEKSSMVLRYRPDDRTVVNLAYRLRRDVANIEQTDISFRYPINHRWSVVGRWNFSLKDNRSLETFGGVEYQSCCWSAKLVARRHLSTATGEFDNGFFVQIELKGLAGFGRGTTSFLQRAIPGYEADVY